jgi:hypothetical protein
MALAAVPEPKMNGVISIDIGNRYCNVNLIKASTQQWSAFQG